MYSVYLCTTHFQTRTDMKKKLYFTVEKEMVDYDGVEETTGNKTVSTYAIVNGELEFQFSCEGSNEDSSYEMIQDYLIDNGMGDDEYTITIV